MLWNVLRKLVARHERYADAEWAFDKATRERLERIRDRIQPTDPVLNNHWLFHFQAELPGFNMVKEHAAHDVALQNARLAALREIINGEGPAGVWRLLERSVDSGIIGWLIGQNRLLDESQVGLPGSFDSSDNQRRALAATYTASRFVGEEWTFVNSLPIAQWSASQIGALARCLPKRQDVWQWVARLGKDAEHEYWRNVQLFLRKPTLEDVRTAVTALQDVGRAFSAIEVVHGAVHDRVALPTDLIVDVLEFGFHAEGTLASDPSNHLMYSVQQLVKLLQLDGTIDEPRLARIEWVYLPLIDPDYGEVGPATLMNAINSQPALFVDLLKTVYRSEKGRDDDQPTTEQEQMKAQHAHRLLNKLNRLPGTKDDGTLDYDELRKWVLEARSMAGACGRRATCDHTLGKLIVRAVGKRNETWPSPELGKLMEDVGSGELFEGFVIGVLNSRGTVMRDPTTGGESERDLAARFRRLSEIARQTSPKLARAFLDVATHYDSYARHEDDRSQRERLGR